jgi:hypothetical protein
MSKPYTQNLGGRKEATMKNLLGDVKPCGEVQLWQKPLVISKRR